MDRKTVLLLCPYLFHKTGHVWELLHITKEKDVPIYTSEPIGIGTTRKSFPRHHDTFVAAVNKFSEKNIEESKKELIAIAKKTGQEKKGGNNWLNFTFERMLHQHFMALKPLLPLAQCYQRTPIDDDKKRFITSACTFSNYTPDVRFNVKQAAQGYFYIETEVGLNGSYFALNTFTQTSFLLEHKSEYFILRFADYKTLSWLAQLNWVEEGREKNKFSENVLARLEKDYKVKRIEALAINTLALLPTGRVMLSEISEQFLMLTPQFDYDGLVIEGRFENTTTINKEGKEYVLTRNKECEKNIVDQVEKLHANFSRQLNGYYYLSYEDAKKKEWFLKAFRKLLELNVQVVGMDMLKHFRYCADQPATVLQVIKEEVSIIYILFTLHFGEEEVLFADLQKVIRSGQQAILLKNGTIALLEEDWMEKYALLVKHAFMDKNKITIPKWLTLALEQDAETGKILRIVFKEEWWKKWHVWQTSETVLYPIPALIKASLRNYQQKGFEWLMLLNEVGVGMFLADDMGLGKTLQTICFIAAIIKENVKQKILIVCPASLLYNWQNELQKFAPAIKEALYHGASRDKNIFTDDVTQVIITSYGTLRTDEEMMASFSFALVILDESHTIKNSGSLASKAVHSLSAVRRLTLSGTPVMNNTFDLFSQLQFILPSIFVSREFFKREYADPIDRDNNAQRKKDLQKLTAPFILRRTKEQVAKDLPPKVEMILWCQMEETQQRIYHDIKNRIKGELQATIKEQGLQKSKLHVLQGIIKLRQVCNSPVLLKDADYTCADSIKTKELMEEIENNLSNHKALVFSQFTTMLDILSEELTKRNIEHLLLTGATPPKERDKMVQQFNNTEGKYKVFLLSLKAGNAGLNLTAADYVFLFDPWWNSAIEQQAIDRTHRIGQTKNVFAYKLICKETIEERIMQLQEQKKSLAGDLVIEEEGFVKKLTEGDIDYLFS